MRYSIELLHTELIRLKDVYKENEAIINAQNLELEGVNEEAYDEMQIAKSRIEDIKSLLRLSDEEG